MYLNLPKYPRYLTAALGSAFVTSALVYMMVQLVAIDDLRLSEPTITDITPFVRLIEDQPPEVKELEVIKPPVVEDEPPPPPTIIAALDKGVIGVTITPPVTTKPGPGTHGPMIDGDPLPIVKVSPQYPRRAQTQGIEGYVILSFTITPTGATANPVVIESQPSGVFDRSAVNAVRKFKYKPKIVNGEAQPVHDVQHRLTYEIANG